MTLNDVMKETADAIREKTGKSDLIAPVDFATEIKGITAGGESGGSNVEYWDISANSKIVNRFAFILTLIKVVSEDSADIVSAYVLSTPNVEPCAVALDRSIIIVVEGSKMTVGEVLAQQSDFTQLGWKQISSEEFYDLNA